MKAVVMAGGFGTRLRPLTLHIPKPMVPIVNRPVMEHVIELLKANGFQELIVLLYFQPEVIEEYFQNGKKWGINIRYLRPEMDFGTAGSVKRAQVLLNETFLVISADVLTDFNLELALRFHQERGSLATILLTRVKDPRSYGIVITEPDGRIRSFLEKPTWGEIFSDTVNSGIYLFEPEVLERIPPEREFDFSKELFPSLLEEKSLLFGLVTPGYWRDIGNLEDYWQAHLDVLHGEVNLKVAGKRLERVGTDVWVAEGVRIHPRARLRGTVILGEETEVEDNALLYNSIVGRGCRIQEGAQIEESILWDKVETGRQSRLRQSVIGSRTKIGSLVNVQEKVVIADDCQIGNSVIVASGVRIWPQKEVENGATVTSSMIWGERWGKSLFGNYGITGLANSEIVPEFASRVGAAYGTILKKGASILSSYDGHRAARVIHRSLMAGLLSTGINAYDLGRAAIPVARHAIRSLEAEGGVHVGISPFNPAIIDIKFFDSVGLDLPPAREKAIEGSYFREEFSRAPTGEVGTISFPARVLEYYEEGFLHALDLEAMEKAMFRIVVDYGYGTACTILPSIFGKMGVEVVALNAYMDEKKITKSEEEYRRSLESLAEIVVSLKCHAGFMLDSGSEKLFLVDEKGQVLSGDSSLACLSLLVFRRYPQASIAVPVSASSVIEEMGKEFKGQVLYTKTSARSMMEQARNKEVQFVGEVKGGYIFPQFQPFADGMFALAKILEMLALEKTSLGEIASLIKTKAMIKEHLPCPWEKKGTIMRRLIEESKSYKTLLIDGVKIFIDSGWVFILPDKDRPLLHINAEASKESEARKLIQLYLEKISRWLS